MNSRMTTFSPCRRYRYTLWREWEPQGKYLMVIGLNPSTADETKDDPTIRKCIGFAKKHGFGALCMTNLFAFRATDPRDMRKEKEPIGEDNDEWLDLCSHGAGAVLAAWGKHGEHLGRADVVAKRFPNLACLDRNLDGSPRHPLYIPYEQPLIQFKACAEAGG